jgi:hypothetical protein
VVSTLFGSRKPRMPRLRGALWRYIAHKVPGTDTLILEIAELEAMATARKRKTTPPGPAR